MDFFLDTDRSSCKLDERKKIEEVEVGAWVSPFGAIFMSVHIRVVYYIAISTSNSLPLARALQPSIFN